MALTTNRLNSPKTAVWASKMNWTKRGKPLGEVKVYNGCYLGTNRSVDFSKEEETQKSGIHSLELCFFKGQQKVSHHHAKLILLFFSKSQQGNDQSSILVLGLQFGEGNSALPKLHLPTPLPSTHISPHPCPASPPLSLRQTERIANCSAC